MSIRRRSNTKYGDDCIHISNVNSQLANISVDVVMPPMNYQRDNVSVSTPQFQEYKKEWTIRKFQNILEQTQTQRKAMDNNSLAETTNRRKFPNIVLIKQLSQKIVFDEDVVEERSPQTISFSKYNFDKTYQKSKQFKPRNKSHRTTYHQQNTYSKVKAPLKLISPKVDPVKPLEVKLSSESILFGLNDIQSSERLTPLSSAGRKCSKFTSCSSKDDDDIDHKTPKQKWEGYVLSKLSERTKDFILKNITPNHLDKCRNTLIHSGTGNDNKLNNKHELENLNNLEKKNEIQVGDDSNFSYFANISNKHTNLNHEKNVQIIYPFSPSKWLKSNQDDNASKMDRLTRGMQKWTGYPTVKEEEELFLQQISDIKLCDKTEKLPVVAKRKDSYNLIPVINEWRNKWILDRNFEGKSYAELLSMMRDISEHIRFAAVSAIGSVIISEQQIDIDEEETLLNEVTKLLYDDSSNVSLAAALTLFSMNKASSKAKDILIKTVCKGHSSECWVAIQCLAEYQYHDNCIIRELISNIMGDDVSRHDKAVNMLQKISHLSMSVQYLVAEKLNSGRWKDRVVACQVLPTLHGMISKDIVDKLSYLLWNDWSVHVRKAAVEALCMSDNGKVVHNAICKKLKSRDIKKQITALKKIAFLGIMTAHLLSPLILCLQCDNDEVCLQSIKICMKMKLKDEKVLNALVTLLSSDRACKIRAYILRALGCIGEKSTLIRDHLLWTLHFSKEATLRKEACSTIIKLGLQDEEIINVLQDIVFIDEDESVRLEVVLALYSMGLQAVGNITLVETIERSVKQLCHKDNVIAHVIKGDVEKES